MKKSPENLPPTTHVATSREASGDFCLPRCDFPPHAAEYRSQQGMKCSKCNYTPKFTDDCPQCSICTCGNNILNCTCLERL